MAGRTFGGRGGCDGVVLDLDLRRGVASSWATSSYGVRHVAGQVSPWGLGTRPDANSGQ